MNVYIITAMDWENYDEFPKCVVVANTAERAISLGCIHMKCKKAISDRVNETAEGVANIEI